MLISIAYAVGGGFIYAVVGCALNRVRHGSWKMERDRVINSSIAFAFGVFTGLLAHR